MGVIELIIIAAIFGGAVVLASASIYANQQWDDLKNGPQTDTNKIAIMLVRMFTFKCLLWFSMYLMIIFFAARLEIVIQNQGSSPEAKQPESMQTD